MNTQQPQNVEKKVDTIKVAIDMHLKSFRVVRQLDHTTPQPAQRFEPQKFYQWLHKQLALARRVVVCYEAGCFGYEPARQMQALGVEVLVISPQNWDEQGKRQVNDKTDAMVMCRRLSEYLSGHHKALSIVRVPSREEEARRAQGRQRDQLRSELRRLQSMGRSLLLQSRLSINGRWWNPGSWLRLSQAAPPWVVAQLETWKEIILVVEKKAAELEAQLAASAPKDLFRGEGALSHELIMREFVDPHRFRNGRQVGNYVGLCPSESTTGASARLGSITKHGNPRLRRLLVQLAWRIVLFQPNYRGMRKWGAVLAADAPRTAGASRKKAIVALARLLAVDLWRIATGRVKAADVGLDLANAT